jgi:hypothetical protein
MASVSELKENVNTLSKGIQGSGQSIPAGLGYAWGGNFSYSYGERPST